MDNAQRIAGTAHHVSTFTEAGRYDDARSSVRALEMALAGAMTLANKPTGAVREVFCLRLLMKAFRDLIQAHETASNLRDCHTAILAEEGPEAAVTKGAAYIAACATKRFEACADEVRAMSFGAKRGLSPNVARAAVTAECVEDA